jgi:hypothetical protein
LSPCTSISSKWIKELIIRPETWKLIQESTRNTLEAISITKVVLRRAQVAWQLRKRIDKWDYMKLKGFCTTIKMVSKLKKQHTEWEKSFACYISNKTLITRIYREFKKLNFPKINDPIKTWATDLNRTFSKEEL